MLKLGRMHMIEKLIIPYWGYSSEKNSIKINRYMFSFHDTANYIYINKTLLDSTRLKNIEKCQNVMT